MISKKLLKEFDKFDHYDQADYLYENVKSGNLTKEQFKHLLYAYADKKGYSEAVSRMNDCAGSSW